MSATTERLTTQDAHTLAGLLKRLVEAGGWTTRADERRGILGVDGSIYDMTADELAALERLLGAKP